MKLMIADDHPGARAIIRTIMTSQGVEMRECSSGEEALQLAREFKPDWVILDVHMPGMNGFQAAAAIRAEHPRAIIVIVSSDSHPHHREAARAAGAVGFVPKEKLFELRQFLNPAATSRPASGGNATAPS